MIKDSERQLMLYTVADGSYQNPAVKFILGKTAGINGNLDKIEPNPADACIPLKAVKSYSQDLTVSSFLHGVDIRVLLAKIGTPVTGVEKQSTETTFDLLALPRFGGGVWATIGKGITLKNQAGDAMPTNPHGLVQIKDLLYINDFDHQDIYMLDTNALNGLENEDYTVSSFNVSYALEEAELEPLPTNAKGQSIIALRNAAGKFFVFVLYICPQGTGYPEQYDYSIIVRIPVNPDGTLDGAGIAEMEGIGKNATELIPVFIEAAPDAKDDEAQIAIPCIGGEQLSGNSNQAESVLMAVSAFGGWEEAGEAPRELLKGDTYGGIVENFDFRQVVSSLIGGGRGGILILTSIFNDSYKELDWRLYKARIKKLFSIQQEGGMTISQAVDAGIIWVADEGTVKGKDGIFFLALMLENGDSHTGDRLWFFRGTELLITNANSYGSPTKPDNYYVVYQRGEGPGTIGGENANSADLPSEALRQAVRDVAYSHSVTAIRAPVPPTAAAGSS
jgi:hypothetical protein